MEPSVVQTSALGDTTKCTMDEREERILSEMETANVNVQDQQGVVASLTKSICEDFHSLAKENVDDVYGESFKLCQNGVQVLEQTIKATRRREVRVASTLKQLRSELDAYRLVMIYDEIGEAALQMKNVSSLALMCSTNDDMKELLTLLKWSEEVAQHEPCGFADLVDEYTSMENVCDVKNATLHEIQRGNKELGLDLDGKGSEQDEKTMEKVYRIIFSLIRCGKVNEARELVSRTGLSAISALLSMRALIENHDLTPINVESPLIKVGSPQVSTHLFSLLLIVEKRKLFKRTVQKMMSKDNHCVPSALRSLWCALSGSVEPLLSLATRTEDRIWVLANAAVETRMDTMNGGDEVTDGPCSVESLFEEVLPHDAWPYFRLYCHLLKGDSQQTVIFCEKWINENDTTESSLPEHLLRFMAHLVVFFRNKRMPHDITIGNRIILKYTGTLYHLSFTHLIPFYCTFLNVATSDRVLLQTMYSLRSTSSRLALLDACSKSNIDYRSLCKSIAVKSRSDTKNGPADLIDRFRWLLYKEKETLYDALIEANYLLRKLLVNEDEESCRILLCECASREGDLADRVVRMEKEERRRGVNMGRAIEEHRSFLLYMAAVDAFNAWRNAHGDRGKDVRRKESMRNDMTSSMQHNAEEAVEKRMIGERNERLKANEQILKQKAIDILERFIRSPGWREEKERMDGLEEDSRAQALAVLRDRLFYTSLLMIAQMHHEGGDDKSALEVVCLVSSLHLERDISKHNLRSLLTYIHNSSGHVLV